jgi:alpha-tubulin suppressor-like RCC1 family protein
MVGVGLQALGKDVLALSSSDKSQDARGANAQPPGRISTRSVMPAALAALAATALWLGLVASPATAIENGYEITTAPPWAAYVTTMSKFLWKQTRESSCTGTIVANDWVMTAAHCVVADDKDGNPTSNPLPLSRFEVVLGRSNLRKWWQGGQWTVDKLEVYPQWNPSQLTGDVALLHLSGPLPSAAAPLPLAPSSFPIADGASPLAYGYGCTSTTYNQYALSTGDFKYSCESSNVLRLTQPGSYQEQDSCMEELDWCLHRIGVSEIQNGDSGGPWVPDDIRMPYILGITSYNSNPQATSATTVAWQYHHATRITDPAVHNWIDTTANILTGTVGTIYRDSSNGASWLYESDGFLHSIPDGGTYLCLTDAGAQVINAGAFELAELPLSSAPATCESTQPPSLSQPLAAGYAQTCATASGGVKCWGQNYWGQLGNGTTTGSTTPVIATGVSAAAMVSSGTDNSCALLKDGTADCWGSNAWGSLGNGTTTDSTVPTPVSGLASATELSTGGLTSCALLSDGSITCWGFDSDGQLGDGGTFDNTSFRSTPAPVTGISSAIAVTTGGYHACALLSGGAVSCWGRDINGQLGDGTNTTTSTPVLVSGLTGIKAVSAGGYHTCALRADGSIACWGQNAWGELGDGSTTSHATPQTVVGIQNAVAISAGLDHTCALLSSGTIECWGRGDYGQLGNGGSTSSPTPVAVSTVTGATAVSAGGFHTCAIVGTTAQCWGRDTDGQLGDGTTNSSATPVTVSQFP